MFQKKLFKLRQKRMNRLIAKFSRTFKTNMEKVLGISRYVYELEVNTITYRNDYDALTYKYYIEDYILIKGTIDCFSSCECEGLIKSYSFSCEWDVTKISVKELCLLLGDKLAQVEGESSIVEVNKTAGGLIDENEDTKE